MAFLISQLLHLIPPHQQPDDEVSLWFKFGLVSSGLRVTQPIGGQWLLCPWLAVVMTMLGRWSGPGAQELSREREA